MNSAAYNVLPATRCMHHPKSCIAAPAVATCSTCSTIFRVRTLTHSSDYGRAVSLPSNRRT